MKDNVIYHNPRCSKSRSTLALLVERKCDVKVIEYLEDPPSPGMLASICKVLGVRPLDIIRKKESAFAALGLSAKDERPDGEWFRLMSENPILIERPIVVYRGRAAVGRPPENVLALLR